MFKIAVDQQTMARDFTFEEISRNSRAHIWSIFGSIFTNHLDMLKTMLWGALLVATSLLNTIKKFLKNQSKLDKNWLSNEQNNI